MKTRTVVFILPEKEYDYIDDYREMLPRAWTMTPLEVVRFDDVAPYLDSADRYAFFAISGIQQTNSNSHSGLSVSSTHYYLTLLLSAVVEKRRKEKLHSDQLCRVELYPDFKTTIRDFSHKDMSPLLYATSTFRNFKLAYMMAYLRFVQKNLEAGKDPWVYENYDDAALRSRLGRDTLYVPDSLMYDRNKFNGKEQLKDQGFFKSYNGIYKYVSGSELTNIIKTRNPSKPLFLFEYVLSSSDKYVGVLEVNSGTVVYRSYKAVTYNIKPKDLKNIAE